MSALLFLMGSCPQCVQGGTSSCHILTLALLPFPDVGLNSPAALCSHTASEIRNQGSGS